MNPKVLSFLRAFVFACLVNFTAISGYIHYKELSIIRTGIDEGFYLPRAIQIANGIQKNGAYLVDHEALTAQPEALLASSPNAITDWLTGKIANLFALQAFELGLALDLIFSFLCYLSFSKLFALFTRSRFIAELATVVCLVTPYIFIFRSEWQSLSNTFRFISTASYLDYDLPFLRGIYTQVSYPIYALVLAGVLRQLQFGKISSKHTFALGLLGGLEIYIYQYPWIALASAVSCLLTAALVLRMHGLRNTLSSLAVFHLGFFISSIPALLIIFNGSSEGFFTSHLLKHYWYLSPDALIIGFLCFALCLSKSLNQNIKFLCLVLGSLSILETATMNLQPILGSFIAPYHFPRFYLQPLFSGLVFILLYETLSIFLSRKLAGILMAVSFASFAFKSSLLIHVYGNGPNAQDVPSKFELFQFITKSTPHNSVIAVMSDRSPFRIETGKEFSLSQFPSVINAVTGRKILFTDWALEDAKSPSKLQRELSLGMYFSGAPRLIWPCPDNIELPGDLFTLTWTAFQLQRKLQCEQFHLEMERYSTCQAIKDYKVDYVLWDWKYRLAIPENLKPFLVSIWKGQNGRYQLLEFNRQEAILAFCK